MNAHYPSQPVGRSVCWFAALLLVAGCSSAGGHLVQSTLAPLGLASSTAVDHGSRWRLPASSPVTVVSASQTPYEDWLAAGVSGMQSQFPLVQAAQQAGVEPGWTLYVRWPDQQPQEARGRAGPIAAIPARLWKFIAHTPSARVGVVCVDNVSRAVVHHGELRVHASWRHSDADQSRLIEAAFARYARALASG
ncbi:MAG: hypothetical protein AB8B93_01745 [Pseudomonadales bacterium]